MRRQDFSYELPAELIAQQPLAQRSASRLLAVGEADLRDLQVTDLPQLLRDGDLLVFNDTRVLPARVTGTKQTGGHVELLLERALGGRRARVQLRGAKSLRPGARIDTAGGQVRAEVRDGEHWIVELPTETHAYFESCGETPLPPYIDRAAAPADRERYQSIFAREPGAAAAPTASLHFDAALVRALAERGIETTFVTLHIGAGTFAPMRVDDVATHVMHAEYTDVGASAVAAIRAARARGNRVVAVGTTVVRSLESAARQAGPADLLVPWLGDTRLFIYPGFRFQVVDALLTNFHLPESTLLMMVSAFSGRERVLAAYRHAVAERYRFFSYGDAMLLTRYESDR